jgi:competence protein ComEC
MRTQRSLSIVVFSLVLSLVVSLTLSSCTPLPEESGQETGTNLGKADESEKVQEPATGIPGQSNEKEGGLEAHFIDVGQGDCCVIRFPDGATMLIDAGPAIMGDDVAGYIERLGIEKLDYVVFTHPHEDHIGGGPAILKRFEIGQIYMPKTSHTTRTYEKLLLAIKDEGLKITEAKANVAIFEKDDFEAEFVGPLKAYSEINDWSAVVSIKYKDKGFVFAGDASFTAEADMLGAGMVPEADVLKVGHHGSPSSTSQEFLETLGPSIAVISVGSDNDYGHPTAAALKRIEAVGAEIYRTDLDGTVVVLTDGKGITVKVEKETN